MNNRQVAQSWYDFPVMPTMDIRSLVQTVSFQDQGGTLRAAAFQRSTTWLSGSNWTAAPLAISLPGATTTSNVSVPNTYDYDSIEKANAWNTLHQMTAPTPAGVPLAVQKIAFLLSGTAFVNNIFVDWTPGITSSDVQLSFRDNSITSGDFTNNALGSVPALVFPVSATYGGLGRNIQVTLLRPGRFTVGFRIHDSAGNYSMYEMDWIVF